MSDEEYTREDLIAILRTIFDEDCGAVRNGIPPRCDNIVTHVDMNGCGRCPEHLDSLDHAGPIFDLRYDFEREA